MIQNHNNAKPNNCIPTTSRSVSPHPASCETTPHGAQKIDPSGSNADTQNHRLGTVTRPNSSILRKNHARFETTTKDFDQIYRRPSNQIRNPMAMATVIKQWNGWYEPKPNSRLERSAAISWGKNEEKVVPKIDLHTFASTRSYRNECREIRRSLPLSIPGRYKKSKIIFASRQDSNQLKTQALWVLNKSEKPGNATGKSPTLDPSIMRTRPQDEPRHWCPKKAIAGLLILSVIGLFQHLHTKTRL